MKIREYVPSDLEALQAMHAKTVARVFKGVEHEYPFPKLEDPSYLVRLVAQNGNPTPNAACLVRMTSECVFMNNPDEGTPEERWAAIVALQKEGRRIAWLKGLDDTTCYLPPSISRAFGKRLQSMGWQKTEWPCWVRRLES